MEQRKQPLFVKMFKIQGGIWPLLPTPMISYLVLWQI